MASWLLWRRLLVHGPALQRLSRLIPLSVSPNSDASGKQSLHPDGDPDRHQNLVVCSLARLLTFPENLMQIRSEVFEQWC